MSRSTSTVPRSLFLLSALALCQLTCAWSQTVAGADPQFKTVEVTGGSDADSLVANGPPILKAIQMLEKIYCVPIAYEDTRYVNDNLLVDITAQVQRTPDPSHRVMGLKARNFPFTYKLPSATPSSAGELSQIRQEREAKAADALQSVLKGYAAAGGPESFAVVNEDGVLRVSATNFLDENGRLQQLTPILDTKITISPGQRTGEVLLNEICQAVSKAAGVNVGIWDDPYNGGSSQMQTITSISGSDVTARSLLTKLLAEMDAQSSTKHESYRTAWVIGGGAQTQYYLSFHHILLKDK